MKRVLVIVSEVSESLLEQICETARVRKEEVVVVCAPAQAYDEATRHRSTLEMVVLVSSWSAGLVSKLYDCLRGTRAKLIAVCTNRCWFHEVKTFCGIAVRSIEEMIESIVPLNQSATTPATTPAT